MSLEQGKFIESFKIAKVVPVHKKGDRKNISNYRPISLLSCFSKLLEKVVHSRPVVLKLVGGIEPNKCRAGTHRTLSYNQQERIQIILVGRGSFELVEYSLSTKTSDV